MSREPIEINLKVNSKSFTTTQLATELDFALTQEKRAVMLWRRIKRPRQMALSILVSKLLQVMNDDMEGWLPSAIKSKSPTIIEVSFKLLISDIDILVAEAEFKEELRRNLAIESLSEILDYEVEPE